MSANLAKVKKIIEQARLKLIRKEYLFFGLFCGKFVWKHYDFGDEMKDIEGCVYLPNDPKNPDKEVMDNAIHLNDRFISKDDYTYLNLCDLVLHESLHIINKHGIRRGSRDPKLWNIAGDHVIDRFLRDLNMTKPYHRWNVIPELDKALPKCSAEEAYMWLEKNQKKFTISQDPASGQITITDGQGNTFHVNPSQGGVTSGNVDPKVKQMVEELVAGARAIHESSKDRGVGSAAISAYLDDVLKVVIPWQELLEIAIKTNIIMKPDDYGWANPNKRLRCHGLVLPGSIMTETNEGVGTLIVHVDTSGSVNDTQLKEAAGIICESMRYFKTIKLITADWNIQQEVDFDSDSISDFLNFCQKEGFKGRGGTSHKPTFDRINEIWEDNIDDLSMVISITDGYSDIEQIYTVYPFITNHVPLVFLLNGGSRELNLNPDIGKIKQIVMDDAK
jgi:predicted metal-dependent peptidase